MLLDHEKEHVSQWTTIRAIAEKIGYSAAALRSRVGHAERDWGRSPCQETRP
jgi:DNA-binding Lrp family transcriptional regulator